MLTVEGNWNLSCLFLNRMWRVRRYCFKSLCGTSFLALASQSEFCICRLRGFGTISCPYGLDLTVSSPEVDATLGGFILVRVKYAELGFPQASQETQRLANVLSDGYGVAGLVINLGPRQNAELVLAEEPLILAITAHRLIALLENDALIETVAVTRKKVGPRQ